MTSHGERIRRESRDTKAEREGLGLAISLPLIASDPTDCTPPVVLSISPWGGALPSHGFEPLSPPSHPVFRHPTYTHNATKHYALSPLSSTLLKPTPYPPDPTLPYPHTLSAIRPRQTIHPASITTHHHTTPHQPLLHRPVQSGVIHVILSSHVPFRSRIPGWKSV